MNRDQRVILLPAASFWKMLVQTAFSLHLYDLSDARRLDPVRALHEEERNAWPLGLLGFFCAIEYSEGESSGTSRSACPLWRSVERLRQPNLQLHRARYRVHGIIYWFTMLQHEDPFLQEYEKSLLGDPVKDRKVYEDASPIQYLRHGLAIRLAVA